MLMLLVADQGEDDERGGRWIRKPIYHPTKPARTVLDSCSTSLHLKPNLGSTYAQRLINCGSLAITKEGHVGFPNWLKWQEDPAAKRMRKSRAKGVTVTREVEGEVEGEVDVDPESIRARQNGASAEYALLKEWAQYGNDPAGLGQWPDTETPAGVKVRRLVPTAKLAEMVAPGKYTAAEVHEVVHGLAAMVRSGHFKASEYTPSFVFSGFFAGKCLQPLREWQAAEKRRQEDEERARLNAPAVYTDEQKKDLVF